MFILTLIWGSSFILIKNGLIAFPADQAAAIRIIFALIFLLPLVPRSFKLTRKMDLKYIALVGLIGNLITAFLFSLAQTRIASSVSGMLNALTPVFTIIVAYVFFKMMITARQVFGILIGLIGAVGLSFVSSGGEIGEMNSFVWLIVIATICYAFSLNIIKSKLGGADSMAVATLAMLAIAPLCAVYLFLLTDFLQIISSNDKALFSLISLATLGTFSTAIGLALYARLIKISTPVFASSIAYLIPIVAVLWGIADGEILFAAHYAAMILIITGVMIANKTPTVK